jgi:hypothetical protein
VAIANKHSEKQALVTGTKTIANSRLASKWRLAITNTLAYDKTGLMTAIKVL